MVSGLKPETIFFVYKMFCFCNMGKAIVTDNYYL